jgi:hypothetical protein
MFYSSWIPLYVTFSRAELKLGDGPTGLPDILKTGILEEASLSAPSSNSWEQFATMKQPQS